MKKILTLHSQTSLCSSSHSYTLQGPEGSVGGRGLRGLQVSNILILSGLIIPKKCPFLFDFISTTYLKQPSLVFSVRAKKCVCDDDTFRLKKSSPPSNISSCLYRLMHSLMLYGVSAQGLPGPQGDIGPEGPQGNKVSRVGTTFTHIIVHICYDCNTSC